MIKFRVFLYLLTCQIVIFDTVQASNADIFDRNNLHFTVKNNKFANTTSKINRDWFLENSLNQKDFKNFQQTLLTSPDAKKYVGLVFHRKYGNENLCPNQISFLKEIDLSPSQLADTQVKSFLVSEEFRSPTKTMTGKQVIVTTPQAREIGISRSGIQALSEHNLLRTSPEMKKRRLDFNREQSDFNQYQKKHKQNEFQQEIEQQITCGLTRLQSKLQKELLQENITNIAMKTLVSFHDNNKINHQKTSRDDVNSFFVQYFGLTFNSISVEIFAYSGQSKTLRLFYNPKDFDNPAYGATHIDTLARLCRGINPKGFEIHHLTMSQREDDILIYLPLSLHIPEIHLWRTDISEIDRADFNKARKSINLKVYEDLTRLSVFN